MNLTEAYGGALLIIVPLLQRYHSVSLDKNAATECQPTDREATRVALGAVQSIASANHVKQDEYHLDDISVLEPEPLPPIEATEALRALRNFVMLFDKSGSKKQQLLRSLSTMGETFLNKHRAYKRSMVCNLLASFNRLWWLSWLDIGLSCGRL